MLVINFHTMEKKLVLLILLNACYKISFCGKRADFNYLFSYYWSLGVLFLFILLLFCFWYSKHFSVSMKVNENFFFVNPGCFLVCKNFGLKIFFSRCTIAWRFSIILNKKIQIFLDWKKNF